MILDRSKTIYIKGTNDTDWECSDVLCLTISPAAVNEMRRIQEVLKKEFKEYKFGLSLNLFLKGVSGYFCRIEDEDGEDYEFDELYITEIPAGFEEDSEWEIRIDSTSVYTDGCITFNGTIKHGSGEYWATIDLGELELLFM